MTGRKENPIWSTFQHSTADQKYSEGGGCTEFVSTGPKSYSYMTDDQKVVVKCKGISLNYENSGFINLQGMKNIIDTKYLPHLVTRKTDKITTVNKSKIAINKDHNVISKYMEKDFKICFDKSLVTLHEDGGIGTLPWGY